LGVDTTPPPRRAAATMREARDNKVWGARE